MRNRFWVQAMALLLTVALIAACRGKSTPAESKPETATLEQVRTYAAQALDGSLSSDVRTRARDMAMRSLLEFLATAESVGVAKSQWERPAVPGAGPLVRVTETGRLRVFALALPGPGVIPPGERVATQFLTPGGLPVAVELPAIPDGGQLAAAKSLEEAGQVMLTVAFTHARGGGFVAHYARDGRTGEFRPSPAALRGLPLKVGDYTLDMKENFLAVVTPIPDQWRPSFDAKHALRLFLDSDIALEWKGKFTLLDERNYSAFQGFQTALDSRIAKKDREEAWEKATRRLPAYLREMDSWAEELSGRLPPGARLSQDQRSNLAVRVIGVPAPEGLAHPSFSVIQYRVAGGHPAAQVLSVPGMAEAVRVVSHQGLPVVLILSDLAMVRPGVSTGVRKALSIYQLTAGGDWAPAPDWFGFLPQESGWSLSLSNTQDATHLTVEWVGRDPSPSVTLAAAGEPSLQLCKTPSDCFALIWTADQLTGANWVTNRLQAILTPGFGGTLTQSKVLEAVPILTTYLTAPSVKALSPDQIRAALGLDLQVFQPESATRVVGFPPNASGIVPLLLQTEKKISVETHSPGAIDRWLNARVVETGADRWLVVLGRSLSSVSILLYRWIDGEWAPVPPLDQRYERIIMERVRVSYTPGQTTPVRGIWAYGSSDANVSFASDGKSVRICEGQWACLTYLFDGRWQVR